MVGQAQHLACPSGLLQVEMDVGLCFCNKWCAFHYPNLVALWFLHKLVFKSVCVKLRPRVLSP